MEWIAEPTGWLGLGTLVLMEIVLGIDNLIFIAILVDKLPPRQRHLARVIGLSLALLMRIGILAGISWRPDFNPRSHPDCRRALPAVQSDDGATREA